MNPKKALQKKTKPKAEKTLNPDFLKILELNHKLLFLKKQNIKNVLE